MASATLPPGFRFHPTDVELIMYYLKRKVTGRKIPAEAKRAITELNICHYSPWELPGQSSLKSKDLEWYFYCQRERKYASGSRTKRATTTGHWKATGKDRTVIYNGRTVGMIKTLVFYEGHPPGGRRTNWVIHEYRMEDKHLADAGIVQDTYVLCKVFEKPGCGPKNGSQYGVFREEDWEDQEAYVMPDLSGVSPAIPAHTDSQSCLVVTSPGKLDCTSGFTVVEPGPSFAEHGLSLAELYTDELLPDNVFSFSKDTGSLPFQINSNENFIRSVDQARCEGPWECNGGEENGMNSCGAAEHPPTSQHPASFDVLGDLNNWEVSGMDISGCWEPNIPIPQDIWDPMNNPLNDISANYMELNDLVKPLYESNGASESETQPFVTDLYQLWNFDGGI